MRFTAAALGVALAACSGPRGTPRAGSAPVPADGGGAERGGAAPGARASGASPGEPTSPAGRRFLKVQLHAHSSGSYDARTPPDRVVELYASRGYDVVVLTDHDRVTRVEPRDDVLVGLGVELTQNSATCAPPPVPGYRCLFHTAALFVSPAIDSSRSAKLQLPFREGRLEAYSAHVEWAERHDALPVVNHPSFHFAADAATLIALTRRGVRHFELVNAALDAQHPDGRAAAERRGEELWDAALGAGATLFGLATDDAHHYDDAGERLRAGKHPYSPDRAWVMVEAERKLDAVREALVAGRFYSTTGVILESVARGPEGVGLRVAGTEPATVRFVGRGGVVLAESRGLEAEYRPTGGEGYVRAVVEASGGTKAWVQPVRVP